MVKKFLLSLLAAGVFAVCSFAETVLISQQQAMDIAIQTPEMQGLMDLEVGKYKDCIESKVLKPCDSDWVTCIEDAWVVKAEVGAKCGVKHDGRLGVNLLIDGFSGKVISRFPEADYFNDPDYCLDHKDCLPVEYTNENPRCFNFIYGQIPPRAQAPVAKCFCNAHRCEEVYEN